MKTARVLVVITLLLTLVPLLQAQSLAEAAKKERLNQLMAVQNAISLEINQSFQNKVMEVMVEGPSKHDAAVWNGRTRTNKIVLFPHNGEQAGDFIQVKITQPQTWVLKGERVDS